MGNVFDIKRFSVDDGPGIRTLVFLKGCALRCRWCSNPESQHACGQVIFYKRKCRGCGKCIDICPAGAIKLLPGYGPISGNECLKCGACIDKCVYAAREMMGKEMSADEVLEIVLKDKRYYDTSGGGMTVSGGEAFLQADFLYELLQKAKNYGLYNAIETCGYADWDNISRCLPFLDLIFYDCKTIDDEKHKEWTGVSNKKILDNLKNIDREYEGELIIRIPFIPGFNDKNEEQEAVYRYIAAMSKKRQIEVLPFHRFGATKYEGLGMDYEFKDQAPIKKDTLNYLVELGSKCGVDVRIDAE